MSTENMDYAHVLIWLGLRRISRLALIYNQKLKQCLSMRASNTWQKQSG